MLLSMLLTGAPIFLTLGVIGAGGFYIVFGDFAPLDATSIMAYKSLSNFTLTCVPLFIMGASIFNISGQRLETVIRGTAPYILLMLIALVIIGIFEPLSTWLPSTMY